MTYVWLLMLHSVVAGAQMNTFVLAFESANACSNGIEILRKNERSHGIVPNSGSLSCDREILHTELHVPK